jgi:hypothetical protein
MSGRDTFLPDLLPVALCFCAHAEQLSRINFIMTLRLYTCTIPSTRFPSQTDPRWTHSRTDIPNSLRIAVVVAGLSSSALFFKQIRYRMNAVHTASVTSN